MKELININNWLYNGYISSVLEHVALPPQIPPHSKSIAVRDNSGKWLSNNRSVSQFQDFPTEGLVNEKGNNHNLKKYKTYEEISNACCWWGQYWITANAITVEHREKHLH